MTTFGIYNSGEAYYGQDMEVWPSLAAAKAALRRRQDDYVADITHEAVFGSDGYVRIGAPEPIMFSGVGGAFIDIYPSVPVSNTGWYGSMAKPFDVIWDASFRLTLGPRGGVHRTDF